MQPESTIPDRSPEPAEVLETGPQSTALDPGSAPIRRRPMIREIIETVIIVIIVYVGLRSFVLPYRVDGSSMNPNLVNGERLFVSRTSYAHINTNALWNVLPWEDREGTAAIFPFSEPKRGDIIVLEPPVPAAEPLIKRIVGLPGERITFADGLVFVNGEVLTEDYIDGAVTACERTMFCSVTVPSDQFFVLGDNRLNSTDSRIFGTIPYDHIVGKAVFSNWPFETLGPIVDPVYELTAPDPR